MIIYKLTNLINQKVYIGQTKDFKIRIQQHKNGANFKHTCKFPLYKAIKKYGWSNFSQEIIDYAVTQEELDKKEIYWIQYYDSCIDCGKGYNVKLGGEGGKHSVYVKRKIGEAQKGKLNHMYGRTGALNPSSKKVMNVTLNIKYNSVSECAEVEQISLTHIAAVCRGERGSVNNNIYRYVNEKDIPIIPKNAVNKKYKQIKNVDANRIFDTIEQIEALYNIKNAKGNIHKACNGQRKSAYGFRWEYIE